jgi:integrase
VVPQGPEEALWWTLRRPFRPLTYDATRMVFNKANAALGANWTLHDLRHSAAKRMVRDPDLTWPTCSGYSDTPTSRPRHRR